MRRIFPFVFLLGAAVIAACGGGGGASAPSTQTPRLPGSLTTNTGIKIFVPTASTSQAKRSQFIVAGTQSVRIVVYTVNGATPSPQPPDTIAQIGPGAPGCTTVSGGVSCTVLVSVPINPSVILEILSYASTDGTGTALASGFVTIDTTQPNITPPPVALGGNVSSIVASPSALTPSADGTPHALTITITAKDSSGNIILPPGNYPSPIALSVASDPNHTITFSPSTISSPAPNGVNTVTVNYNGGVIPQTSIAAAAGAIHASISFIPNGSGGGTITAGARIFEYAVPSGAASAPWGITGGPGSDKSLWFTESGSNIVGKLFTGTCTQNAPFTCQILEGTSLLPAGASPTGIAAGNDGNLWVGAQAVALSNHMFAVEPLGTCATTSQSNLNGCAVSAQTDPQPSPAIFDVRNGNDNLIHMAATTSAGFSFQLWPVSLPAPWYSASSIGFNSAFGESRSGWVTDPVDNMVAPVTCAEGCGMSPYAFATGGNPQGIVELGQYLYVADGGNNAIQYFDPTTCPNGCQFNAVQIPTPGAQPEFLTVGPDGNIWFTEFAANKIGVLVVNKMQIYEIPVPTPNAGPWGITLGPDGNIWFTEKTAGKIGVVVP